MIKSKRLELRPLLASDFPDLLAMYQEPDSNKYIRPLRGKTPAEYEDFLALKLKNNRLDKGWFFTVLSADNKIIGSANFNFFEALQLEHIGVHLKRDSWSKGYGSEIVQALLKFARSQGRSEVFALVEEGNHYSQRMLEKCGLKFKENRLLSGDHLKIYSAQLL